MWLFVSSFFYLSCSMCQYYVPVYCRTITPLCLYIIIFFFHSSIDGHLSCFHLLASMKNTAINIYKQVSVWTYIFISLWYTPRNGIVESYVSSFLRKCQNVSHGCCIMVHYHRQQCTKVLISPYPCQCLFYIFVVVFIKAILVGMEW